MINLLDYKDLIYNIIGAAMRVHTEAGFGLLEPLYNECLQMELEEAGIKVECEKELDCYYRGRKLKKKYRMDMIVGDDICIELKSVRNLLPEHRLQLFNYLKLTRKPFGLLINFGGESLEGERYIFDESLNDCCLVDRNMEPIPQNIGDFTFEYEDPYEDVIDLKK